MTYITVRELIATLSGCDPDLPVILSRDEEGNGYRPLADVSTGNNSFDPGWDGDMHLLHLTPELEAEGYGEEDVDPDGVPCIVLYPR
jgi:hypothetical protein